MVGSFGIVFIISALNYVNKLDYRCTQSSWFDLLQTKRHCISLSCYSLSTLIPIWMNITSESSKFEFQSFHILTFSHINFSHFHMTCVWPEQPWKYLQHCLFCWNHIYDIIGPYKCGKSWLSWSSQTSFKRSWPADFKYTFLDQLHVTSFYWIWCNKDCSNWSHNSVETVCANQ